MIGKLTAAEIEEVLQTSYFGRLGCSDKGRQYVVPINYVYNGRDIIAHSLPGMKISMMRSNPAVCFQVDQVESFTRWKSVIAWGKYQELTEERERYAAMKLFVDRMLHMKISETAVLPEAEPVRMHPRSPGLIKPVIYRIILTEKTGRFENDLTSEP